MCLDNEHDLDDAEIDDLTISSTSEGEEDNAEETATASHTSSAASRCTPNDIVVGPHESPVKPIGPHFPFQICGKKKHSFNSRWYKKYPWIETSKEADAVFCFSCRFFASTPGPAEDWMMLLFQQDSITGKMHYPKQDFLSMIKAFVTKML